MKSIKDLIKRDLAHVWHPCTQMKDHEKFPPLEISKAKGSFLFKKNGRKLIDGISSWWCKSLGHCHPEIIHAVKKQMNRFEHIIPAGTVQQPLVELSEELSSLMPSLNKVFYSDGGSAAIEIAVKMALQYHMQNGNDKKKILASLENGYHGETLLSLSLGDCHLYSTPFAAHLRKTLKISPLPYVNDSSSPIWDKMPEDKWIGIRNLLDKTAPNLAAIVLEPIVQGAGGMRIYSKDLITRIRNWSKKNGVLMIADEIMTGFHRTGPILASMHAGIVPDFVCLSKGLTAGWGAMSAVITSQEIYDAFYDEYSTSKAFLHSSTYAGNALCASAALEALKIYRRDGIQKKVETEACEIRNAIEEVANETGALRNVRSIGYLAAADIFNQKTGRSYPKERRTGFMFYQKALKNGALLRNLGDSIYFMPPLNSDLKTISQLAKIATKSLKEII
ncbi:MAG TPA: adenosylmethionine--8-amino-7-oxononanoate transaminase [Victivallales bacterium]|nr:adenosylmethionine--8-amino-7-oxononanoate transaminase [Victivallales bacterium]